MCFLLIYWPYEAFDEYDSRVFLGAELLLLAGGLVFLRGVRKYLLATFLGLLLFVVLGECAFRVTYFGFEGLCPIRYCPADYRHPLSNFEYDKSTYTGRKPGLVYFKGGRYTVNSKGFRGPDFPESKPEDTYRIVLIGASTSMGSGVDDDETFTHHLQTRLNEAGLPQRVEIINLSIAANESAHILHIAEHVAMNYEPDLLMCLANESRMSPKPLTVEKPTMPHFTGPKSELFFHPKFNVFASRFFFINLIHEARSGHLEVPAMFTSRRVNRQQTEQLSSTMATSGAAYDFDSEETPAVRETLDALTQVAGPVPVVLYLLNPIGNLLAQHQGRDYRRSLAEEAHSRGMRIIDAYENDLQGHSERELLLYPGEKHPNSLCHRIYADIMYGELLAIVQETAP